MKIDGANLLDGILGNGVQDEIKHGVVSIGNGNVNGIGNSTGADGNVARTEKLSKGEQVSQAIYQKPQPEKKSGTTQDVMQQAENMNTAQMKDKMVVATHTTTAADCKKVEEDGFSLDQTQIETIVTVTDKIKMELAKAGVDVSYFIDGCSAKQIEEMTGGNAALTQALAAKLQQADLPVTPENMQGCKEAVFEVQQIHALSDGAIKYLLDNGLEPTIANVYKAQHSGSAVYVNQSTQMIDFPEMQGQISDIIRQSGQEVNEKSIADSRWLIQNQIPLTAQNLNKLQQLQSMDWPIATEPVSESVSQPITESMESVLDAIVTALVEGKQPQDAMLLEGYSLADQARHAVNVIQEATQEQIASVIGKGQEVTIESLGQAQKEQQTANVAGKGQEVTIESLGQAQKEQDDSNSGSSQQLQFLMARRQLEEVRMMMTQDAAYMMLKQGISVNTSSMQELISRLKELENGFYRELLTQGGIEATEANVSLFAETTEKIEQLKEMPAYALGTWKVEVATLEELHQSGSEMQQNFQQANERYEKMQTEVRKDLGDSIQKAFQNVDDILEGLDLDTSAANERAVRILGYNRIEITHESILQMKAADQQVQTAFSNLTPAVVREFISRGIDPLDMQIQELNKQAEQIKAELGIDTPEEKYSEYLYKLEQNQNITPEERSAYIGIYRLMSQIEQSDGAAVGALVNQGAQITMRNLLSAVRSEKRGAIDVSVDHSFGELQSGGYQDSIIGQIEAGYQTQCISQAMDELTPERFRMVANEMQWEDLTPEQFLQQLQETPDDLEAEQSYYAQKLQDLAQCAQASQDVYQALEQYELPHTMMNILGLSELMSNRNGAYRKFFGAGQKRTPDANISTEKYMTKKDDGSVDVDFDAIKEELLQRFSEDAKRPEGLAKAMAELAECAEKCTSTMILEPDVTTLDIRELRLMNAQISVGAKMASSECFSMPIVVDGEVTNVTLKIVRGKEQKGLVNITLETRRFGKIAAELKAKQKGISGYIASDSKKTRDYLQSMEEEIAKALQPEGAAELHFVMSDRLDLNHFAAQSGRNEKPSEEMPLPSEEMREVQTKTLYGMAEGFIRILHQMDAG